MKTLSSVPSSIALDNGSYTVAPGVTNIIKDAFLINRNIKKIVLPPNLASIEKGYPTTVNGIGNLAEFEVAGGGTTNFHTIDGVLFEDDALVVYPQGKKDEEYQVPDGITKIDNYGIATNSHVTSIDLNEVVTIAEAALSLIQS